MLPEENLCLFFLVSYQVQRTKTTATDCRTKLELLRNVMAHTQKPDFVYPRNGRVHLNRWGRQFSRLLAAEVCASA